MQDATVVVTDCVACSIRCAWTIPLHPSTHVIEAALEGWSQLAEGEWLCPEHTAFVTRGVFSQYGFIGRLEVQQDQISHCAECRRVTQGFRQAFEYFVELSSKIRRVESRGLRPTDYQRNQLNECRFEAEQFGQEFALHRCHCHEGKSRIECSDLA